MTQRKDIFNYAHEIKHNLLLPACFFLKTFILVHLVIFMSNFTLFFDFQIVCKVYLHKSLLPDRALLSGRSSTEFLSDRLCLLLCPLLRSSFVARKPLNKSAPCELLTGSGDVTVRESAFNVIQTKTVCLYIAYIFQYTLLTYIGLYHIHIAYNLSVQIAAKQFFHTIISIQDCYTGENWDMCEDKCIS